MKITKGTINYEFSYPNGGGAFAYYGDSLLIDSNYLEVKSFSKFSDVSANWVDVLYGLKAASIYENGTALSNKYLSRSGGTLSGSLVVSGGLTVNGGAIHASGYNIVASNTGDVFNYAQNNTSKCYIACRSESTGTHGIYSNGYYNGSSHTANGQYLIYRSTSNNTIIPTELYTHNEGYTTNRPVVGTNAGTNAVGVIVSNPASFGIWGRWEAGASADMTGGTIACPSSDIRLKENIQDSTVDALSVINAIRMRQFDWKDKSRGHWDCGMIVDEMERDIDPNFCLGGGDDGDEHESYKSVNTFYLQGYEVKAIQELSQQISDLKSEIKQLKQQLQER